MSSFGSRFTSRSLVSTLVLGFAVSGGFALTGCTGGSGGGGANVVTDFSACNQKPDAGASAIVSNAEKTDWVQSDFFSKPYDRYDLEAVLDASSTSTTTYVQSLGISLNRVPTDDPSKQCPTYYNLPVATGDFAKIWDQASSGIAPPAHLAGLFFEYCGEGGRSCSETEMVNPTILVFESSDRWTLVHEMMHYNFNQARKASTTLASSGYLDRAAKGLAERMSATYKEFVAMPNRADLASVVADLRSLAETHKEIFVRKSLEEISIEGMLIGLWSKNILRNATTRLPDTWYMEFSSDQFLPTLPQFEKMGAELKKAADENFWPEISADVDSTMALVASYRTEIQGMIAKAKAQIKANQRSKPADGTDFFTLPRSAFLSRDAVEEFNVVDFEKEARAHVASHDPEGSQAAMEKLLNDLASTIK